VAAVGRLEPGPREQAIVTEDAGEYRRLVLVDGRIVGAVLLGHHPQDLAAATAAVKSQMLLDDETRAAVQAGDWPALTRRPAAPARATRGIAAVPA
jgi:NAD(P)H-nitrite reductase large subunit